MARLFAHPDALKPSTKPPRLWPRVVGVVIGFVGLGLLLALGSYDWRDVSAQCAPPQSPPHNLVGYGGAWFGYLSTLFVGAAAWTLPVWVIFTGVRMALGRRLGWRFLGMFLGTVSLLALSAQLGRVWPAFAAYYGQGHLNNGGYSGGVLGHLLVEALVPAIGGGATCSIFVVILLVGVVFLVGVRELYEAWFQREEAPRPKAVDVKVASSEIPPETEPDPERPMTREEKRAQKEAEKQRKAEEREAEKQRKAEEREAERLRKAEEREAEKQRKAKEREEEKEKKLFEKQQAAAEKAAQKEAEEAARKEEMKRRTEEFLERQRQEAEKARLPKESEPKLPVSVVSGEEAESEDAEAEGDEGVDVMDSSAGEEAQEEEAPVPVPHIEYTLPTIEHLNVPPEKVVDTGEHAEKCAQIIVETLEEFGMSVEVAGYHRGPVITQFELVPAPGLNIKKIASVSDNLQLALAAKQIRIVAPIPGKTVIGIEVPNAQADMVAIREIAEGETWRARIAKAPLPLLFGKDIAGADFTADLASMPHMLVAGATGAGKSACINSLLAGLLLTRTPDELRLIMVDPKCVEFTPYAEIPHLLVPVITEWKKVGVALQWAVGEMNRRLKMFARSGVRNIADYNKKPVQTELFPNPLAAPDGKIPYVVIIVDELADLMQNAKNEVEGRIATLAAKARAAGIHLILATQRPSVDVVTGVIKSNIPGRIAFKVASQADSLTILGGKGAESLLGRGDMLVSDPRMMGLTRVQGCWVSDEEVAAITNDLRAQGKPMYVESIKKQLEDIPDSEDDEDLAEEGCDSDSGSSGSGGGSGGSTRSAHSAAGASGSSVSGPKELEQDLVREALIIFSQTRRASTSSIQRRLSIGYNRAANLLDKIESLGYIGPATANNAPREILVDLEEILRVQYHYPEAETETEEDE